jgi:hypothetical protein
MSSKVHEFLVVCGSNNCRIFVPKYNIGITRFCFLLIYNMLIKKDY